MARFFFRRSQRLRDNERIKAILSQRRCFWCGGIGMYVCGNEGTAARFAVSVSAIAGGAVERNRIKRFGREAFRLNRGKLRCDYDYFLIIKGKTTKKDSRECQVRESPVCGMSYREFETLFMKLAEGATGNS